MKKSPKISVFAVLLFAIVCLQFGGCAGKTSEGPVQANDSPEKEKVTADSNSELTALPNPEPANVSVESLSFTDIYDEQHQPFADEDSKAIALVFIATDCPIANYFQPTLAKLTEEFISDGVQFYMVHPNPDLKLDAAIKHAEDFGITTPVIMDTDLAIAKKVAAKVTPEAVVIDRSGAIRYRGRINDLYVDFGKKRRVPTVNDLRDALEAVVRGEEVANEKTKAIGCYIPYPRKSTH